MSAWASVPVAPLPDSCQRLGEIIATYYEILGVDPTATPQQIKDAYRRLAMKYHPDRWAHATDEVRRAFTAAFQQVQEAYDCLIGARQAERKPEPKPQDPPWSASDAAGWRERTAPRRKSDTFGGAWKFNKRRCALVGFILLVVGGIAFWSWVLSASPSIPTKEGRELSVSEAEWILLSPVEITVKKIDLGPQTLQEDGTPICSWTTNSGLGSGISDDFYTVRRGDSVSSIALHFHISVATLRLLNNKPHDPAILNETLRIPCIAYTRTEAVR
jgi:hypothetical protein